MAAEAPLRILILGAHPDDADIKAGGTAAKWCALGHTVRLVSLTDGRGGHQTEYGPKLVKRRQAEAEAAAAVLGASYEILDLPDGGLDDRLEYRYRVVRLIRQFGPEVVLTHRATDYHPDHRATGLLVQDAAYQLTVPAVCPEVPHLRKMPVILYFSDAFRRPCRFEPHLVVDVEDTLDKLVEMLHCHSSQFYEWLPYNAGNLDEVPGDEASRKQWLGERIRQRIRPLADRYREVVVQQYGPERGREVRYLEAFEVSEFGSPLDEATRARLFPFVPMVAGGKGGMVRKDWVDLPEEG